MSKWLCECNYILAIKFFNNYVFNIREVRQNMSQTIEKLYFSICDFPPLMMLHLMFRSFTIVSALDRTLRYRKQ